MEKITIPRLSIRLDAVQIEALAYCIQYCQNSLVFDEHETKSLSDIYYQVIEARKKMDILRNSPPTMESE